MQKQNPLTFINVSLSNFLIWMVFVFASPLLIQLVMILNKTFIWKEHLSWLSQKVRSIFRKKVMNKSFRYWCGISSKV